MCSVAVAVTVSPAARATAAHCGPMATTTGGVSAPNAAAQARAALPTPEDKQAAWASLVDRDDLSNTIVRSAALGFTHPAGVALLEPFVPQYFDALLPIWEGRTFQVANYLIVGLFPAPLADVALRDATRAWLAANVDAPPALRRLVHENLAGVERALAVQERDAE